MAWVGGSRTPPDNAPPPPPPPPPGRALKENALLWPKPQTHTIGTTLGRCSAGGFRFTTAPAVALEGGRHDTFMQAAFERYRAIVFPATLPLPPATSGPALSALVVVLGSADLTLGLETSENYTLDIGFPNATLHADTVYGALRGLETFSQMVQPNLSIREQRVTDWPRFPFRAVLIDTGRHYLPVPLLRAHIDAMCYNKMNVLHWHIVDMPSFPFVSKSFPNLSAMGAFDARHVYTPADVAGLVDYAQQRGVRIIPEFDSPSHTFPSWGKGGPADLLTSCPSSSTDNTGPLRADREQTYQFLETLFTEVAAAFPDETFHGGGDEVSFGCWSSNPEVKAWMTAQGMGGNLTLLNNHYMTRLLQIITGAVMNKTAMFWRECNNAVSPSATLSLD
jgi:hexosaminidase